MSRSKIFNMIKNRGTSQSGRNAFDLSGFEAYSEKCQMINPLRCIDTIPKDYFNINISDFTQLSGPMKAASFVRGSREICAYFVPYNSIWHNFNQYQATREDPDSTLLQAQGISYEPRFSLFGMYIQAAAFFAEWIQYRYMRFFARVGDAVQDYYTREGSMPSSRIIHLWLTDPTSKGFEDALKASRDFRIENPNRLAFTEWTGSEFMKDSNNIVIVPSWFNAVSAGGTNYVTSSGFADSQVGQPCWADVCRKFDMLGYGNLYPIFSYSYSYLMDETVNNSIGYFLNNVSSRTFNDAEDFANWIDTDVKNVVIDVMCNILYQIKYMVNGSASTPVTDFNSVFTDQYVNIYPMFAYNRCFYDMFRNSYYDLDYDVRNFNADFVNSSASDASGTFIYPVHTLPRFWKLESHQYKKDMFTGILPDTQFGAVSSIDISHVSIINDTLTQQNSNATVLGTTTNISNGAGKLVNGSIASTSLNWSIPSAFDVFALRRAECLQQYRMDLLRAGNKTRDIFKQIYGSNPKSELDEAPYFIDVYGQDLNIDPIIATADTGQGDNGTLGDIAARVTSRGDGHFQFSTEDFGCLLILDYTLIDPSYNSTMLDPTRGELSQESHFIPQLQNLGFEAVFGHSLNMYKDASVRNRTLGYAPPYLNKKTYIDKVHGNFVTVGIPTLLNFNLATGLRSYRTIFNFVGAHSIWTCTRKDMQESDTVQLSHFYGNPNILDDVMVQQVDATMETDQFICHTLIKVSAVRPLSELGLPRFC